MRYFYDCEFNEDGVVVDLISIAIVSEEGEEFYGVNRDVNCSEIGKNKWVMKSVMPYIPTERVWPIPLLDWMDPSVMAKETLQAEVYKFLKRYPEKPELWAWYGSYDHVCLAQLWGPMVKMPPDLPWYTNDLKSIVHLFLTEEQQEAVRAMTPDLPHEALSDAINLRDRWLYVNEILDFNRLHTEPTAEQIPVTVPETQPEFPDLQDEENWWPGQS